MNHDILNTADMRQGIDDMAAFIQQLLFVIQKLPFASAAESTVGAGRIDPVGRGLLQIDNPGFGKRFLFLDDAGRDPIQGNGLIHKDRKSAGFGDAFTAEGQVRDHQIDQFSFFNCQQGILSKAAYKAGTGKITDHDGILPVPFV